LVHSGHVRTVLFLVKRRHAIRITLALVTLPIKKLMWWLLP